MEVAIVFIIKALKGEVGMSNELDDLARSLFNGQLPNMWRRLAPVTKKTLGNWMDHFFRRNQQYNSWVCENIPIVIVVTSANSNNSSDLSFTLRSTTASPM